MALWLMTKAITKWIESDRGTTIIQEGEKMGKGDLKTRRGKIHRGSSGKTRPKKRQKAKAKAKAKKA